MIFFMVWFKNIACETGAVIPDGIENHSEHKVDVWRKAELRDNVNL